MSRFSYRHQLSETDHSLGNGISVPKSCVSSCKDIYINQRTPTSGVYTIHTHSGLISVYCDFFEDRGYTYISKNDLGKVTDLSSLYTEDDHASVRVLYHNGEQHAVSIEQLSDYKYRYQLNFQLSDADGYKRPLNHGLAPYVYVGFLPRDFASLKSKTKPAVQGYRTAGTDFKFHNCNRGPNSYLAFFANPKNLPDNPYYRRCCDNKFMREWINRAQLIPHARYMPEEFYYMYEMHMGGCGGYLSTSHTASILKGAALGLGFKLEK